MGVNHKIYHIPPGNIELVFVKFRQAIFEKKKTIFEPILDRKSWSKIFVNQNIFPLLNNFSEHLLLTIFRENFC